MFDTIQQLNDTAPMLQLARARVVLRSARDKLCTHMIKLYADWY